MFVIITRGAARIMLRRPFDSLPGSNRTHDPFAIDLYIWVNGVHPLHDDAVTRGLTIVAPLEETFYHITEFAVRDIDGRVVTFGE